MATPKLSRTIKSLLEKRGSASGKAAKRTAPSSSEAESLSTDTTALATVPDQVSFGGAISFASSTPLTSDEPTATSSPNSPRSVPLESYLAAPPEGISETLPDDLRVRLKNLQRDWSVDTVDRLVESIVQRCLWGGGNWEGRSVDFLVRYYLDATGIA